MSFILKALAKRQAKSVEIGGTKVWLRSMTLREIQTQESLEGDAKAGWAIGCTLVNESGEPEVPRGELTPSEYAKAVLEAVADTPQATLYELSQEIAKLNSPVPAEKLAKN